jgi:hypothetical protein
VYHDDVRVFNFERIKSYTTNVNRIKPYADIWYTKYLIVLKSLADLVDEGYPIIRIIRDGSGLGLTRILKQKPVMAVLAAKNTLSGTKGSGGSGAIGVKLKSA